MNVIDVAGLTKKFGDRTVVDNVALQVAGGIGFKSGPIERALRDGRAGAVMGPSNEMCREWIGQTALIIGAAAIITFALLLLFLRNAIRRSLIASRATMDSAATASWTWYFVLLVFVILVVVGLVGSLFGSLAFIGLTVGVLVIGIVIALMMTSKARRSNQ